jgi:hypothetical protein
MGTGDWLMSAVSRNPEGLLLLAAGAALLLRSTARNTPHQRGGYREQRSHGAGEGRRAMPGGVSRAAESARDYAQSARDYASDVTSRVAETATSYAAAASDYASETSRAVYEQSERYARQAQSTVSDTVSRVVQDQPLAIALAGLAAGAAVAAAFPATDIERRTLGPAGEKLTGYAGQTGEQLRSAATRAGERLMDVVEERGLSTDNLKDAAHDAASAFREGFSGEPQSGSRSGAKSSPGSGRNTQGRSDISGSGA